MAGHCFCIHFEEEHCYWMNCHPYAPLPNTSTSQTVSSVVALKMATYLEGGKPMSHVTAIAAPRVATAGPRPHTKTLLTWGGVMFGGVLVRPTMKLFCLVAVNNGLNANCYKYCVVSRINGRRLGLWNRVIWYWGPLWHRLRLLPAGVNASHSYK